MSARVVVRRSVYRCVPGWSLTGRDTRGRRLSVFFQHESAARRSAQRVKRGREIRLEDFAP